MIWIQLFWIGVAVFNYDTVTAHTTTSPTIIVNSPSALIGPKECLEGPSYWCQNFTTAKHCQANHHCIRTVWEHQQLPPDNNHICDVCKNAVKEARTELQSNETQQNLKLVLEGSCLILIPIKVLAHECVKMIDEVIPELIEALSSMMNPQMVCANAGLCNSPRIAQLLAELKPKPVLDCGNCTAVAGMAERNFRNASRDHVLNSMLELCGGLGSFSDGCAAAVIVHFNSLYESLNSNFNAEGVCHLAGVCQQKYHSHSKTAEVKAVVPLKDDMPCELCEQLVEHLRDILVANTTEKEFEQVLLGLCGTTKSFKKQCVDMVETYYPMIYGFLTTELDGKVLCTQIGLCPKSLSAITPLYPLLPAHVAETLQKDSSGLHRVPLSSSGFSVHSGSHSLPVDAQLPLDQLVLLPQDKDLCQMCEYFLHFLQNELTDPVNEQIIIKKAEKACDGLPDKFAPTCHSFMDTYARAIIALLAQDIDPSQVCPKIGVCPGLSNSIVGCQPCKVTANHLIDRVGSNTTEINIQKELLTLCLTLPYEESRDCNRLLRSHQEDLADMITAEFTTDEMCFFMKYCAVKPSSTPIGGGDTETNEIPNTLEDEHKDSEICVLCEFVMKTIEKQLEDNNTQSQIRYVVEHVCQLLPRTVRPKCVTFVDQYSDLIVTLLAEAVQPKLICQAIEVCPDFVGLEYVRKTVNKCVVCESLMGAMQGVIEDADVERDINRQLEMACFKLPRSMKRECEDVVRQLAPQIETILGELPLGPLVCQRLQLCGHSQSVDLVAVDRCSEGQSYWCLSTLNAAACQKIEHCQKKVWLADKPNKKKLHTKTFIF